MPGQEDRVKELEQVRERCLLTIRRLREQMRAEIQAAVDEDSVDAAADIYERARVVSLIASQQAKLRALDHAIAAAKAGTYGICEMCGQPIPDERLRIIPETTLCVRCAGKVERNRGKRR